MANRHRGEISAELGGKRVTLCLTLGALAELEDALDCDLFQLCARVEAGHLKARDITCILGAGLRGAGHEISDEEVASMQVDGGAVALVRLAAELLTATFGGAEDRQANPPSADRLAGSD